MMRMRRIDLLSLIQRSPERKQTAWMEKDFSSVEILPNNITPHCQHSMWPLFRRWNRNNPGCMKAPTQSTTKAISRRWKTTTWTTLTALTGFWRRPSRAGRGETTRSLPRRLSVLIASGSTGSTTSKNIWWTSTLEWISMRSLVFCQLFLMIIIILINKWYTN